MTCSDVHVLTSGCAGDKGTAIRMGIPSDLGICSLHLFVNTLKGLIHHTTELRLGVVIVPGSFDLFLGDILTCSKFCHLLIGILGIADYIVGKVITEQMQLFLLHLSIDHCDMTLLRTDRPSLFVSRSGVIFISRGIVAGYGIVYIVVLLRIERCVVGIKCLTYDLLCILEFRVKGPGNIDNGVVLLLIAHAVPHIGGIIEPELCLTVFAPLLCIAE